jgi:membrane protease YdiL (CAAX protease family)
MDNNSLDEMPFEEPPARKLPFNNLFLNAGVVDGHNKFWMYLFGIIAFVSGYILMQLISFSPLVKAAMDNGVTLSELADNNYLIFDSARTGVNKNFILLAQCSLFVGALFLLIMVIRNFHKKHVLSVITGFEKFRFRHFFFAFFLWASIVLVTVVVTYLTSSTNDLVLQFDLPKFLGLFLICIVFLPIQTLSEELLFRGYLLQGFAQVFRNGFIPLIITSFMFGLAHMSNPETQAFGVGIMLTYYVVFALFLGTITLMDEGLELAYGIHLAQNLITALSVTSQSAVLKTDAVFYTKSEDPKAELLWAVCSIIVVFVVFWFKFKWKNFSLIIK